MPVPQPQLQPVINLDDGKRHKLDKKITEEEFRRSSEQEHVEDEVSSFKEVKVQKKFLKEGKIEVVENPRFMTDARRKELERRQRQKEESMPVVKEEKRMFSFFPHYHDRSESQPAITIQQPAVVEHEHEVQGASAILPPSEAVSSSRKATGSPSKDTGSPSKTTGSISKATGSPSKITGSPPKPSGFPKGGLWVAPANYRNLHPRGTVARNRRRLPPPPLSSLSSATETSPSDDSDVEDNSPSKPKGFHALFGKSPAKQN